MKAKNIAAFDFDLFRLSRSKEIVDISPNTLRSYHKAGLPFYTQGKATFVSKADLAAFIKFGHAAETVGQEDT